MIKLREKVFICIVIAMMVITQIPASQLIYAQSNQLFELGVTDVDSDSKKIEVHEIEEGITKIGLFLDDKNIQTKDVSDDLSFTVYANGTYEVRGFDANDAQKNEKSIEIKSFENLTLDKNATTHKVKIVSRYDLTEKIVINKKEEVTAKETQAGYYEAYYTIPKNGEYTFDVVNFDGKEVASKTMKYTDVPHVGKTGEIIISNEDDMKQLAYHPGRTFVLENDITLTSDSLKDVNFSGTLDGNGYMISGFTGSLFNSMKDATINNVVIKGALANTSTNSTITNSGFYVEASETEKDNAVILKSTNTTIQHSFAFMNVEGKNVAGFVLEGTGSVSNSYVSGYLSGKEVYGFGKEIDVKNSYINASLVGEERILFSHGEIEESFYDAQINDVEELKASPMYTKDMISKDFKNEEFKVIEGVYPQIRSIEEMKAKAQQVSTLSVQSVKTDSNLSALEGKVETKDSEEIKWDKENEEISAKSNDIMNRFALRSVKATTSITAGDSTTAKTTQITHPTTMGDYYKVVKASETVPDLPTSHKVAIESGWKIMYWSGSYKQTGLGWNTDYSVYSTNLANVTKDGTVKTNYGKLGGKITLTGTYDFNEVMTATLSDNNTTKGTLYFETADTLDKGATWTTVQTTPMDGLSTTADFIVTNGQAAKYLRVRFVADNTTGYEGTFYANTDSVIKKNITAVTIENKTASSNYTLNDQLIASIEPTGKENDVDFTWYQKNISEAIGTGRNYTLKSSDIGKEIYVKAVAKSNGDLKGEKASPYTSAVLSIQCSKPAATSLKKIAIEDITTTIEMDVADHLYRFGIATSIGGTKEPYAILSRGKTQSTITNLTANTTYYIYVQQVGENGYVDSEWSDGYLEIKTDNEHVRGDVTISGDAIYKKTLTATITNAPAGQNGNYAWYRLDENGNRGTKATGNTYTLTKEDIGFKIEAVYEGTNGYAGEVTTISNTIAKEEKTAPTNNLTNGTIADTTVDVTLPANSDNEKYIIGISNTSNGVPIEQLENGKVKEFSAGESYTIKDLQRDTEYYVFVRYAENETHQKSEWIASSHALQIMTLKKAFKGTITFTSPTASLMKGQTLTAELNPEDSSFNYKGEWTWTKVASNGSTTVINNFALTDNKQGTTYDIPENEDTGVTYKVTFSANVGYEGSIENTSSDVKAPIKEKYTNPDVNDIILESIDDESIKLMMAKGDGQYQFFYKEADTNIIDSISGFFSKTFTGNDGYIEAGSPIGSNVDLVMSGLKRNTKYIVKVQRIGDEKGEASDFVYSVDASTGDTSVTTKKTDITGKVEIDGTLRYGETLTVKYTSGTYANKATSTDQNGTWQWYRDTTKIAGATNTTYVLQKEDIGHVIKGEYAIPENDDFQGSASTSTKTIEKALCKLPEIDGIKSEDNATGDLTMVITGNMTTGDNIYYRVQKSEGSTTPDYPTSDEQLKKWNKVGAATITVDKDANNEKLESNIRYIVYYIKQASETNEGSAVMSKDYTMGSHSQKGTVTFTGNKVIGKTITATLKDANNTQGTWKWYKSTKTYPTITSVPNAATGSEWEEITSGYSPASNATSSELNVSEELFAHYIRAEFVANEDKGYSGAIRNTGTNSDYVKKIYEETLTLTSSTMDGNKNPKAYTNSIITGTINNYVEKGNINRNTIQFKVGNTVVSGNNLTIKDNVFTYKMPNNANYDNLEIVAEVSKPKTIALYVDKDLKALTTGTLNSKTSTSTSFTYTQGIPISNANDLEAFIKQTGNYTDRSASSKYIVTNNINMSSKGAIVYSENVFAGTFDGGFHQIVGTKNPLFANSVGVASKPVVLKNTIFFNANIRQKDDTINSGGNTLLSRAVSYGEISNILVVNSIVEDGMDTGYIVGHCQSSSYKNVATFGGHARARGSISGGRTGAVGGINSVGVGNTYENVFTVSTNVEKSDLTGILPQFTGGIVGYNTDSVNNYKNVYVSSNLIQGTNDLGMIQSSRGTVGTVENVYYDKDIQKTTPTSYTYNGVGLNTVDLVGIKRQADFGNEDWYYREGFYPSLKFVQALAAADVYGATRGAFISVDGATSNDNMFNGNIYGPIQIPKDFQKSGYSYSTSDSSILKIGDNGTIVPVGSIGQKAKITVEYEDLETGGTASNDFEFTVGKTVSAMSPITIRDNTTNNDFTSSNPTTAQGLASPQMNQTLKADSSQGTSYQWYKRKSGTTTSMKITGATSKTYTLISADIGYEMAVLVSASGYASTYSPYTKAVVSIKPTAPNISEITDSSVVLKPVNGVSGLDYEFGYMRADENASPTLIEGTCDKDGSIKVENLIRNKPYHFYVRVAPKSGVYDASDWSSATTQLLEQTNVTGNVSFGANINNGSNLSVSIEKTNGQTGKWKLERVKEDNTTTLINESYSTQNTFEYPLTNADVGSKIKATFTGSGDFKDTVVGTSNVVKKTITNAPSSPVKVSDTYNSLTLQMENAGSYEIAYSESATSEKHTIKANASNEEITVPNLKRNTTYYLYARVNGTDATEVSEWSNAVLMTTGKEAMDVSGSITMNGATKTNDTMNIQLLNGSEYSGTWTLYTMVNGSNTKFTISPSLYTINPTTNEVTYKIRPKDAGKKLGAEFSGNGDFSGSINATSAVLNNAKLDSTTDMPRDIVVSTIKDTSIEVNAKDGNQNYQYGYVKKGGTISNINIVDATGYAATKIAITGLTRNSEYDIYVRKASETGYDASDWVKMPTIAKTDKSTLTGTINYQKWDTNTSSWKDAKVGVAEMGEKYKVTYTKGSYDDNADDTISGHWQWYANNKAIENATTDTYTIESMEGIIEITVKYIANDTADFKDARNASIGTLTKQAYNVPSVLPNVSALLEDGNQGSKLQVESSDVANVYYYVQKVSVGTVPEVILSSVADQNEIVENKWFKAAASVQLVVEPNTEYVVYVARLEDGGHNSSGVVSQRAVKSEKENLNAIDSVTIAEADTTMWKVQQEKELRINIADKPVEGVWQYYVSKTSDIESSWQNITSEIKDTLKEGKSDTYSYTKMTMPIKYTNGYYVRAIFTGRGNVEGTKTYTSTDSLIGTQIQGHVEINSGITNEVFVPIEVKYVYAKDSSNVDIKDEDNGIWTWYRETEKNSNTYEEIVRSKATVGLSDRYTPTSEDVDKKIYAVYTGAPTGIYSGSVESAKLSNTERATQNTPNPITLKQVNGTTVQINLPSNLKVDGKTMAQPVLEYRKVGATDWIINKTGDAWIGKDNDKLKANTEYEVRARFNGTSEYKPSVYTATITVKTDNQSFDEENLEITQPTILETGNKITAAFTGSGYDEGYFIIKRSDGTVIEDHEQGTVSNAFLFRSGTNTIEYTITKEDIGSNIIIQYQANDDASTYGGYVEKNTEEVLKPANPNKPGSPTLTTIRLHEDQLKVDVDSTCEYALNTSATALSADSGDWEKFVQDSEGKHRFDNLTKGTEYYLHVRYGETENYRASDENISAKTSPWEKSEYTIAYKGTEGATNTNPTKYTELDATITLSDASKAGYTFKGWTTDTVTTPTKDLKIESGSDGVKEFTANWDIITYDITYNLNDGTLENGQTNPLTYTVESDTFTLTNPSKNGYTFKGWSGTDIIDKEETVTILKGSVGNKAYTANWQLNDYTITYDLAGGTVSTDNKDTYTVESDTFTLTNPTKKGYTFTGWSGTDITDKEETVKISKGTIGNKTYTANWQLNEYTITYDFAGGIVSTPNKDTYTVESDTFTLINPTKTGYTFKGWTGTDLSDKQVNVTITKGSIGNRTYTANWQIDTYTITYILDGGTNHVDNPGTYQVTDSAITLNGPSKTGYAFKGWKLNGTGEVLTTVIIASGSTGNLSYSAVWEKVNYKVTFDSQGGSPVSETGADYQEKISKPVDPTKEGYTFNGWFKEAGCTNEWIFDTDVVEKATTLYAKWSINQYTVTFDGNGGSDETAIKKDYNEKLGTLPTSTRIGYTFDGWFTAETDGAKITEDTKMPVNGATYYAHWTINQYTAKFDGNGGSDGTAIKKDYNERLGTLQTSTREGYTFDGWYTAKTGGNKITEDTTMPVNGATYYAHWTINQYTVSFDGNGGSDGTAIKKDYNAKLGTLQTSTRIGYTFDGWYTAKIGGNKITEDSTMPAVNTTYYAQWKTVEYVIKYNLDGGLNNVDNPSLYTIETADITLKAPTKENYVFTGWTWDSQTTPQKVVKISKGTTGTKEYSANWRAADHEVIFVSNGGSVVEKGYGTHNQIMEAPSNPTKEGYTFIGWYKEAALTNQWDFAQDIVISDMTLYAKWEINHYDVTFDTNEGSTIVKQIVDHGEKASKPATDPTREYYTFVGWYSDETLETEFDFNTLITSNKTLYAKWNAKSYVITYELNEGKNHKDNPASYTVEDEVTLKSPTKENYTFVGWTWSGQSEPQKEVTIVKGSHDPITYQANWKLNEYQVHFETNGGNTIEDITKEHGSSITKPANPTKDNYIFVGWYSDEKLTKPWDFDIDVVTKEMTLYAKYYAILHNVTASSTGAVEKNTKVTLSSEEEATIYYTVDGSNPSKNSLKYTEAIVIDKTMSIKAMAIKEGYGDSEVTTFEYTVKGNSKVESEKDSPLKSENKKEEIIEAVLTDKEYKNYLSGTDVNVRIACNTSTEQMNEIIKNVLDGRTVGTYYDITIYKTIGNNEETIVTTLRKPIRLVLTIPTTLYPEKGVTRVFDVIRIHDDKASLLSDLDKDETTVTIESDAFSTYILCYKDTKTSEEDKPVIAPIEKPITGGNAGSQVTDKPTQGITSNTPEEKDDEPKKEDVTKPKDEKESRKEEANNMLYYVAIPLAIVVLLGIVIVMKLKRRNKQ